MCAIALLYVIVRAVLCSVIDETINIYKLKLKLNMDVADHYYNFGELRSAQVETSDNKLAFYFRNSHREQHIILLFMSYGLGDIIIRLLLHRES